MSEHEDIRDALDRIAIACAHPEGTTLAEVLAQAGRSASAPLLLVLLALPFLTPIPLPGLSTPIGLVMALLAIGIALGREIPLPQTLSQRRMPPGLLPRVIAWAARILHRLGHWLRPRLGGFTGWPPVRIVSGLGMALAAILLALPLPIPFTNAIPAWGILLISLGLLYRDGLALLLGWLVLLGGMAFFTVVGWGAWMAWRAAAG